MGTINPVSLTNYNTTSTNSTNTSSTGVGTDFTNALKTAVNAIGKTQTTSLDQLFQNASEKYGVPVNLLKAVAKAESNFNANAVSSAGAQGIMQLMPSTASSLGVKDSFDAEQNILGGAKLLGQLLTQYNGDTKLALAAYNAGSGNVAKYGGIPPFKETQNYVVKVMASLGESIAVPDTTVVSSGTLSAVNYLAKSTTASDSTTSYNDTLRLLQLVVAQMKFQALNPTNASGSTNGLGTGDYLSSMLGTNSVSPNASSSYYNSLMSLFSNNRTSNNDTAAEVVKTIVQLAALSPSSTSTDQSAATSTTSYDSLLGLL